LEECVKLMEFWDEDTDESDGLTVSSLSSKIFPIPNPEANLEGFLDGV
jgi:hypothetical protein